MDLSDTESKNIFTSIHSKNKLNISEALFNKTIPETHQNNNSTVSSFMNTEQIGGDLLDIQEILMDKELFPDIQLKPIKNEYKHSHSYSATSPFISDAGLLNESSYGGDYLNKVGGGDINEYDNSNAIESITLPLNSSDSFSVSTFSYTTEKGLTTPHSNDTTEDTTTRYDSSSIWKKLK